MLKNLEIVIFQVAHPALLVVGFGILGPVNVSALADLTRSVPLNMSLITKYVHDKGYDLEYDDVSGIPTMS